MQFTGIILKGYSGFYYVWEKEGEELWECSLRGKLRLTKETFLPGDQVLCTALDQAGHQAVLEQVLPRASQLSRPPVANVEQVVIMVALAQPEPDLQLVDRLLIMAEEQGVKPLLCLNKADLVQEVEWAKLVKVYEPTGYPLVVSSIREKRGLKTLKEFLQNKLTVLAGPSGVGKTSLLNALEKRLTLPTGEISKVGRGKHTTRHSELLPLSGGGLVADTPGFSRVNLPGTIKREELRHYYPDFQKGQAVCYFQTCLHRDEPDCGVKQAVRQGQLDQGRYQRYLGFLQEVITAERSY